MLLFFSGTQFYTTVVHAPTPQTPTPAYIETHSSRFRHFSDCLGAVDGTHIRVTCGPGDHDNMRNRKGYLSQNCLFACNFDLQFIYALTGWDGSMADATIWNDAHGRDFRIPDGKYLLADAGFGSSDVLLVPYRGVRYHLKEWNTSGLQ